MHWTSVDGATYLPESIWLAVVIPCSRGLGVTSAMDVVCGGAEVGTDLGTPVRTENMSGVAGAVGT